MADIFVTLFCKVNSIRFPTDYAGSANSINPFDRSYAAQLQDWQTEKPYQQKATFDDTHTIQVHTQLNYAGDPYPYPALDVYDINDNLITSLSVPPYTKGAQQNPNNFYTPNDGSSPIPLNSYLWQFKFSSFLLPTTDSGVYYLLLTNTAADGFTEITYRSEPILVYEAHPNTVVVKGKNLTNRASQNVLVNGWLDPDAIPEYAVRVEGMVNRFRPKGVYMAYLQQQYESEQLNAQNYRAFTFNLGGVTSGVPDYRLETIGELLIMDEFKINETPYIIDADSSESAPKLVWDEITDSDASQLLWAEKGIREKYNNQGAFYTELPLPPPPFLPLWTSPWLDPLVSPTPVPFIPYAVPEFTFTIPSVAAITVPTVVLVAEADEDAYYTWLNATFIPSTVLSGSFLRVSGVFTYIPGATDFGITTGAVIALYRRFRIRYETDAIIGLYSVTIKAFFTSASYSVIDWGDLTAYYTQRGASPSGDIVHPFAASGTTYDTYVYHNDIVGEYHFTDGTLTKLREMDGDMPSGLKVLRMYSISGLFSPAFIPIARCTLLRALRIFNTNIIDFEATFLTEEYNYLKTIILTGNALSIAAVDGAFNAYVTNTPSFPSGGTFDTSGQTPAAPPTGASATARAALNADSWAVDTD